MIKELSRQEDITFLNVYASKNRGLKCTKHLEISILLLQNLKKLDRKSKEYRRSEKHYQII